MAGHVRRTSCCLKRRPDSSPAKFRDAMETLGCWRNQRSSAEGLEKQWMVDVRSGRRRAGDAELPGTLRQSSGDQRQTHRWLIDESERDLSLHSQRHVRKTTLNAAGSGIRVRARLPAAHAATASFQRLRYYGWDSRNSKLKLALGSACWSGSILAGAELSKKQQPLEIPGQTAGALPGSAAAGCSWTRSPTPTAGSFTAGRCRFTHSAISIRDDFRQTTLNLQRFFRLANVKPRHAAPLPIRQTKNRRLNASDTSIGLLEQSV